MHFEKKGEFHQDDEILSLLFTPLVVRIKILSYLTLKEQLILRQVCTTTKQWIDSSHLSCHVPVTIIDDHGPKTFTKFLEKRPPHVITSVHIKNDTVDYLEDSALPRFMAIFSPSVSSLRMQRYFPCNSTKELAFFEGFKNLLDLELGKVSIPIDGCDLVDCFPQTFKNLKTLKIGSVKAFPEPPEDSFGATLIPLSRQRQMGLYIWNFVRYCENIEFLGYPQTSKYFYQAFVDGRGRGEFGVFCDYVRHRHLQYPQGSKLKFCDFQNDDSYPDSKNALPLLKLGSEFEIKFLNVNSNLFQFVFIDSLIKMYNLPKNAGDCILSLKHFNCLITKCLPSVTEISMCASIVNTMLDYSCIFNGPKSFPKLQEVEIIIDIGFSLPETDIYHKAKEFHHVQTLLTLFFYDTEMIFAAEKDQILEHVRVYENVRTLSIKFTNLSSNTVRIASPEDLPLEWIVRSLPNVTKLTLHGWKNPNCFPIWKAFPKLEQLVLRDCCENLLGPGCLNETKRPPRVPTTETIKENYIAVITDDTMFQHFAANSPPYFIYKNIRHTKMTWIKLARDS